MKCFQHLRWSLQSRDGFFRTCKHIYFLAFVILCTVNRWPWSERTPQFHNINLVHVQCLFATIAKQNTSSRIRTRFSWNWFGVLLGWENIQGFVLLSHCLHRVKLSGYLLVSSSDLWLGWLFAWLQLVWYQSSECVFCDPPPRPIRGQLRTCQLRHSRARRYGAASQATHYPATHVSELDNETSLNVHPCVLGKISLYALYWLYCLF